MYRASNDYNNSITGLLYEPALIQRRWLSRYYSQKVNGYTTYTNLQSNQQLSPSKGRGG